MKQKDEILTRSIDTVIEIVLKPGQMLIIPPGWWHEVKSLDLSVSVNIWTAEPRLDKTEREKEALTRIMGSLCQGKISTPSVEDDFGDIDQLLNKATAFQLAALLHTNSLKLFIDFTQAHDIELTDFMRNDESPFNSSALHFAACNPDSECMRYVQTFKEKLSVHEINH